MNNFLNEIARIHNEGISRTIILNGNINDIFYNESKKEYINLVPYIVEKCNGPIKIVYELNGPIRINESDKNIIKTIWNDWKKEEKSFNNKEFDKNLEDAIGNPTFALEFLRQISVCSRNKLKGTSILFIIEAADIILPSGDILSLNDKQLHRISIVYDWITDSSFSFGKDTLILVSESRSLIHPKISKLPQVISLEINNPNFEERLLLLRNNIKNETLLNTIAENTAGLPLYIIFQLCKEELNENNYKNLLYSKLEQYIKSQLGEDVAEFKKPKHLLSDCVGFKQLKKFLNSYLIPRIKDKECSISGAAVAGPIGGGKTYIFEAVAAECDIPVLVIKNIRSQWFGQTDVIFERLKRTLESLGKILIFIDEADTQLGSLSNDAHETEKRLIGKFQSMMSDTALKGKVFWLLITARIHLLSPDIRRPGRAGDLIIPVLDPYEESDRLEFCDWLLKDIKIDNLDCSFEDFLIKLNNILPKNYSCAAFSALKNHLKYIKNFENQNVLIEAIEEIIEPCINLTRRYQTLQALSNTTRKSLLPNSFIDCYARENIEIEIKELELKGIK